jgi:radial spoke head protein 4A
VVARSLVWPGAVAVAAGSRFVNVYIGNGVVYENKPYSPPLPAPVQSEWAPSEEDGDALLLVEQPDVREDPTPPVPEGEGEEED